MQRLLLTGILALPLAFSSFPQSAEPVRAPAELVLNFSSEGDRHQFHLGELIPAKFSYVAETPRSYTWVSQNRKLKAGYGLKVACVPDAESVLGSSPATELEHKFEEMLRARCGGVGEGFGSGCADCDSEHPLSTMALTFDVPLNLFVRFRTAGKYACVASSADVTAGARERVRDALLMKSNSLDLTIIDDPPWAQAAARIYAEAYETLCRGEDVPERRFLQCTGIAEHLTFLDTPDSLAAESRFFDGKNHGWDNGFWKAFQDTSHPADALRLVTSRIQDPDVQVTPTVLESLASWDLRLESPDAITSLAPVEYHSQAVGKLRKYGCSAAASRGKTRTFCRRVRRLTAPLLNKSIVNPNH